jgi:hypothetical protein
MLMTEVEEMFFRDCPEFMLMVSVEWVNMLGCNSKSERFATM